MDCHSKNPEKDGNSSQKVEWYEGLGAAFYSLANFSDSIKAYSEMAWAAEISGDKIKQTKALHMVSASQFEGSEIRASLESAEKSVRCGEQAGDSREAQAELSFALYRMGRSNLTLGNYADAIALGEKTIEVAEKIGEAGLRALPYACHLLAAVYISLGDFEKAVFYEEQEIKLNRRLGNIRSLGNGLNSLGEIRRLQGDGQKAVEYYDEALSIMKEIGNKSSELMILSNRAGARLLSGEFERAETELRNVIEMVGDAGHFILPETYAFLAQALLGQNKPAPALEATQKSLALAEKAGSRENIGTSWRVLGMVASCLGQNVEVNEETLTASDCFKRSLQIFVEAGIETERARTLRDYAQSGSAVNPAEIMNEAREIFMQYKMPLEAARTSL